VSSIDELSSPKVGIVKYGHTIHPEQGGRHIESIVSIRWYYTNQEVLHLL
jgi:hypothetical protein